MARGKRAWATRPWIGILLLFVLGLIVSAQNSAGTIAGQIRLRDGAPAAGVRVAAMAATAGGNAGATSALFGLTQTDSNGRYRLEGIPAGRYYVVAGPVERFLYFPGVDSVAQATVVIVNSAALAGMDFTVDAARLTVSPQRPAQLTPQTRSQSCPTAPVTAPTQALSAGDFVQLERTTCFGTCPQYSVRIDADGSVRWNGGQFVKVTGTVSATIDAAKARSLIERYRANGFWNLCSAYSASVTDGPTFFTTVSIAGNEKKVSNYFNAAPAWLGDLEGEIDRLADTHRWLHGDPLTEVLDFSNLDADSYSGTKPGTTPLMQASGRRGTVDAIRGLLAARSDPNAEDASGWTALMYAALANDPAVVKALLDGGANVNARARTGITPLMAQIAIASIVTRDPIAPIRTLLAAGADINAVDSKGQTALMMLMPRSLNLERDDTAPRAMARVNLAAFLRDSGARSDLHDASGRTALDILREEAARVSGYSKAQYEKLRMILEQPAGSAGPVAARATIRPRGTELQSLTLQRAGADPVSVTATVGADGAVALPAVAPGVYTVLMSPAPAFPVSAPPIAISSAGGNIEIDVPALRRVRVNTTIEGGGAAPLFWLLLARPAETPTAVNLNTTGLSVRPLPAGMTAALAAGARPQLIELNGPANTNISSAVRISLPVSYSGAAFGLAPDPSGNYYLILPEGVYFVTPLLAPAGRAYGNLTPQPVTADMYKMKATSGDVDLEVGPLNVSGAGQEIQITFSRTR